MTEPLLLEAAYSKPEMIDNPLYDFTKSKDKLQSKREQDFFKVVRREVPSLPDQSFPFTKLEESEASKSSVKQLSSPPFLAPTPRFRSYTCSSQFEEKTAVIEKTQNRQKFCANLDPGLPTFKKPVKFSRSEVGQSKPPLPSKSQVVLDMQNTKGRDYRESSELPHHRKHQSEDGTVSRTIVPVVNRNITDDEITGRVLKANSMDVFQGSDIVHRIMNVFMFVNRYFMKSIAGLI
ncbi:hypothetical protein JD844_007079 [Phrynosoma platyrhinos]|uniref:Breast cancer type 2 susceptibility protein n=1 Tax=Phrynosoma platyrhinos TaxID=52577 RepID=A0ABQ7T2W5_PHRPL|nr:hypothetical protein JD844_007079 [Phrynosoma platyrhinos]